MKSLKSFFSCFEKVSNKLYNVSVLNLNLVSLITESRANSSKKLLLLKSFLNKNFRPFTFLRKLNGIKFKIVKSDSIPHFQQAYSIVARFDQISFTFCPKNRPLFSPNRARGSADPSDPPLDPLLLVRYNQYRSKQFRRC